MMSMILRRRLTIVGACLGAGGLVMGISTLGGEQASQRAATEVAPIEFATGSSEGGGSASNEAADGTAAAAKAPTMPGTQPDAPAAAPTADVASAGDATPGTLVSSGPARPAAARGARSSPLTAGIDTKLTPVFCIADECHPYRQQHDSERPDGKAPSMVAGPVGPRGEAGPRGERGARGARGEAGRAGADGESGPPGQAGPQGLSGPKGDQGERGFTGPAGPRGETGATGPKGDTGARGAKGDTGARGAKGDTGATGPAGPKGDRGPTGATGPEGPAGPTGATGPAGPAGPAGPEGPAGPIGATGPAGPTGATGPAGPTGATGPAGPTGATGPAGPTGATGPAGPAGATWRGGWSSVATYAVNDLVEYEGSTYINIVSGTSVDPPSLSPLMWSLFAAAGTDAPTSAGTAGGDLTGTYPDPQIASGVVGSPEITDGSIGVIDMAFDPATQAELDAYVADDLVCTGCVDATDIGVLNGEVKFQRAAADVMLSSGDTAGFAMFVVKGDGTLNWGDGTVAPDVSLFRGGPDVLQTSDLLKLTGGLECQPACIDTTDLVDASVDSLKVANHTIQPIDLARTPAADLNKGDMQPVAAGTIARVTFTGDMELTPVTMFDPAVDPTKVVIPLDGRYLITAGVGYEGFPFGNNRLTLIHTSGTSTAPISRATGYGTGTFAAQGLQVGLSTQHRLGANDFLQLEVMQDSDATIVPAGTEFSVTWIGN